MEHTYLENSPPDNKIINEWIQKFHTDGYVILPNVLKPETCSVLMEDMEKKFHENKYRFAMRFFENSQRSLELFWIEPIVSFAEALISDTGAPIITDYHDGLPAADEVHVIHNNAFSIKAGDLGLSDSRWHSDDTPHVTSLNGEPLTNIKLNVLAFTCLYYTTDVLSVENGPTQFIQGSHLFGKWCSGNIAGYEDKIISGLGSAGTVVMFNNQTWHRGSPNTSNEDRYCVQVSYAKRLVGHKYYPFMNYQMPEHIYKDITDTRKLRLLGFLNRGAYG